MRTTAPAVSQLPCEVVGDDSLSGLALDLGFSSQSHFTRLFSDLTGMTPARYRRQCRPTVG